MMSHQRHHPIIQFFWRVGLRLRFLFFQRHRYNRLVLEHVARMPILVLPEVFNPGLFFSSEFLVQQLRTHLRRPGLAVLDLGAGSGVGALAAARHGANVVAVDINPAAVRCARINALLNQLEAQIDARQGDLFTPVQGEQFDLILFNPPFFRGRPRNNLDHAWRSTDTAERFAAGLASHLRPGGYALVVLSTNSDLAAFLNAFDTNSLAVELIAKRDLISETLLVYRIQ